MIKFIQHKIIIELIQHKIIIELIKELYLYFIKFQLIM
jgi:hypothetical protein